MNANTSTAPIEVRDLRKKRFFVMDNEYLNGYAKICGWQATLVYLSLCRHADREQVSFPSINLIAEENGISRNTVMKGLRALVTHSIIRVEKRRTEKQTYANNVYVLVDKRYWKKDQVSEKDMVSQVPVVTKPSPSRDKNQVPVEDSNNTHINNTHIRERARTQKNKKVTQAYLEELQQIYSKIDVSFEWEKARDWKAARGKSYKDERAFFRNWLRRAKSFGNVKPAPIKNSSVLYESITDEQRLRGRTVIEKAKEKLGINNGALFGTRKT